MSTQMIVRVNPELKNKVNTLAKGEGKSISEVVRELLEEYVKNRDIGLYIDDLWQRIGKKLIIRKIGSKEIQRAIREVRARKLSGR
jgi:predicted DNA-binding protein